MNSSATDFSRKAVDEIDLGAASFNANLGNGKEERICYSCSILTPDISGHVKEEYLSAAGIRNQEILKEMLAIYGAIETYTLCGGEYEAALKHLKELDSEKERNISLLKSDGAKK